MYGCLSDTIRTGKWAAGGVSRDSQRWWCWQRRRKNPASMWVEMWVRKRETRGRDDDAKWAHQISVHLNAYTGANLQTCARYDKADLLCIFSHACGCPSPAAQKLGKNVNTLIAESFGCSVHIIYMFIYILCPFEVYICVMQTRIMCSSFTSRYHPTTWRCSALRLQSANVPGKVCPDTGSVRGRT